MPRDPAWTLRYYRDGDEQGILDCLIAAFGSWPAIDIDVTPIEHLQWKLSSDPLGKDFTYVAETHGGRIIGCQIVTIQRLQDGDRTLLADTCTDYAVHPDFQGRGLSRDLWQMDVARFTETFDLIMSISDSPAVLHQIETIGWGKRLANSLDWLERTVVPPRSSASGLASASSFDPRFDDFCRAALAPFRLAIVRDSTYLNWRFADRRAGRYATRIAEEGGELAGYVVYTVSRGNGVIADLLVLPERLDLVDALMEDAARFFAERGIGNMRCWSPQRHLYLDALLEAGFQRLRPVGQFGFGPHGDRQLPARDDPNAAVHFMPGDTDIV